MEQVTRVSQRFWERSEQRKKLYHRPQEPENVGTMTPLYIFLKGQC